MGGKWWRVFRNSYKGHMDKTKVGVESGEGSGVAEVGGGVAGLKRQKIVLEQQKIFLKKSSISSSWVDHLCEASREAMTGTTVIWYIPY